jgi:endonuclease/exonuclease/phosphatase family metal-dependent hydrolase
MVASLEANVDASLPTAVVGDFNAYPNLSTYKRMTDFGFLPAYELSDVGDGEKTPTFEDGTVLDYCFLRNTDSMDVLSYRVYNRSEFGQASDHYPLYTQIEYKKAP